MNIKTNLKEHKDETLNIYINVHKHYNKKCLPILNPNRKRANEPIIQLLGKLNLISRLTTSKFSSIKLSFYIQTL